ncbi:MAG: choice-of-anchor tandem repeat GloVer-containing protein [Bryobacteraceae bacterium]|jgi:uncharacterized protein (TIGR03437 family)
MKRVANALGKLNRGKRARAVLAVCAAAATALPAQTLTTLHSFNYTDGAHPMAGLVQGTDGNYYGTTFSGGTGSGPSGAGTAFRITPSGTLKTLYNFCSDYQQSLGCLDGAVPGAGLVQATDGNFYGTTEDGGSNACPPYIGCGTVFRITPSGTLTTLYNFCYQSGCADGFQPTAALVQGTDGNFYGTTTYVGAAYGTGGTIFKMTPSGTLTTLYSFCQQNGCADGEFPGALIQSNDGSFYGTTSSGGDFSYATVSGGGTIFKITPSGALTTLYSFCQQKGCPDGETPAALIQSTDGNFYGTTVGDESPYDGTVFKITPGGTLTTLYNFLCDVSCPDGGSPNGLLEAADGNLYGTTGDTFFKITPGGTLTTLYNFCSDLQQSLCLDGLEPNAGLVQATDGSFYGTTYYGGTNPGPYGTGAGTVFRLSLESVPPVPVVNAGGVLNSGSYTTQGVAPGSIVSIFGTNLAASTAGASAIPLPTTLSDVTSVTFNGTPAGLYFVSQNQINAQLPFSVLLGQNSGAVNIVVTRSSGTSAAQNVIVVPASPGVFTTTANGLGQAFAYDNTTAAIAAPTGAAIGPFTTAPISVSSGHALIIACTGLGSVNPSIDDYLAASDGILRYTVLTPTVLIGGVPAQPIYSVLSPQFVSEYQIGVTPAANTPTGNAVSLQIQIGGVTTSNQVTIAVAP